MIRIFIFFVLVLFNSNVFGQDVKTQGVFVFSFTRYVQWPADYNQGDFLIAILGESPMVQELQNLADRKKVDGRNIKLIKINSIAELKKCNIFFLAENQNHLLSSVLAHTNDWATLIITQQEGLGKKGSCINFVVRDGKVAFELNMEAITKRQLKVFTELTRHAIII